MVEQNIKIVTENIVKGQERLDKLRKNYLEIGNRINSLGKRLQKVSVDYKGYNSKLTRNAAAITKASAKLLPYLGTTKALTQVNTKVVNKLYEKVRVLNKERSALLGVATASKLRKSKLSAEIGELKNSAVANKLNQSQISTEITQNKRKVKQFENTKKINEQKRRMFANLDKQVTKSEDFQRKILMDAEKSAQKIEQQQVRRAELDGRRSNNWSRKQVQAQNFISKGLKKQTNQTWMTKIANQGYFKTMKMGIDDYKKFNKQGGRFATIGGKTAHKLRNATHGLRGFKMEMLGVMFFGMSMQKMFSGLLRTSLEWTGVFDILGVAMGILFLPIALKLLKWAIKFLDWVSQLTEAQKLWIGKMVVWGAVIGGIIMVIGTLALGIGSLILAFGSLVTPLVLVAAGFLAFGGIPLIISYFKSLGKVVEENGEKLKAFGISDETISKLKERILKMINTITTTLEDSEEPIRNAGKTLASKLFNGFVQWIKDNPLIILGALTGAWLGGPLGAGIGALMGKLFQKIDFSQIDGLINSGIEILDTILKGITDNLDDLKNVVEKLSEKLMEWVIINSPKFIEIGANIAGSIVTGIIQGIANGTVAIGNAITGAMGIKSKTTAPDVGSSFKKFFNLVDKTSINPGKSMSKWYPRKKYGGIVNGRLNSPVPIIAHGGERVIPANRVNNTSGMTLNITNNIEVSDRDELERLITNNNTQITEEVKRMINI